MQDRINNIIGEPYDKENNNCWHTVQKLDTNAPAINDLVDIYRAIQKGDDIKVPYKEVKVLQDGDILLLGDREDHLHHAGFVYDGLVIHNSPIAGVIAQYMDTVRLNFKVIKGYRYVG